MIKLVQSIFLFFLTCNSYNQVATASSTGLRGSQRGLAQPTLSEQNNEFAFNVFHLYEALGNIMSGTIGPESYGLDPNKCSQTTLKNLLQAVLDEHNALNQLNEHHFGLNHVYQALDSAYDGIKDTINGPLKVDMIIEDGLEAMVIAAEAAAAALTETIFGAIAMEAAAAALQCAAAIEEAAIETLEKSVINSISKMGNTTANDPRFNPNLKTFVTLQDTVTMKIPMWDIFGDRRQVRLALQALAIRNSSVDDMVKDLKKIAVWFKNADLKQQSLEYAENIMVGDSASQIKNIENINSIVQNDFHEDSNYVESVIEHVNELVTYTGEVSSVTQEVLEEVVKTGRKKALLPALKSVKYIKGFADFNKRAKAARIAGKIAEGLEAFGIVLDSALLIFGSIEQAQMIDQLNHQATVTKNGLRQYYETVYNSLYYPTPAPSPSTAVSPTAPPTLAGPYSCFDDFVPGSLWFDGQKTKNTCPGSIPTCTRQKADEQPYGPVCSKNSNDPIGTKGCPYGFCECQSKNCFCEHTELYGCGDNDLFASVENCRDECPTIFPGKQSYENECNPVQVADPESDYCEMEWGTKLYTFCRLPDMPNFFALEKMVGLFDTCEKLTYCAGGSCSCSATVNGQKAYGCRLVTSIRPPEARRRTDPNHKNDVVSSLNYPKFHPAYPMADN